MLAIVIPYYYTGEIYWRRMIVKVQTCPDPIEFADYIGR